MVLKTVKRRKYDIENSTESETYLETDYFADIDYINKSLPLEHKDEKTENIKLCFKDGRELILILRTLKNNANAWVDNYEHVFLMNDEGKTIERII